MKLVQAMNVIHIYMHDMLRLLIIKFKAVDGGNYTCHKIAG